MIITIGQLAACTGSTLAIAGPWIEPISAAMAKRQVISPKRAAAFLAQIGVESARLTATRESLNYTPEALMATFNNRAVVRFTKTDAYRYGRTADHPADQHSIANIAYASRYGNGPVESGDGWRYRGGGPGQLSFKDNYLKCGDAIGFDLIGQPDLIARLDVGSQAFGWYWDAGNPSSKSLNGLADAGNIDAISKLVNGGTNGIAERRTLYYNALKVLS